MRRRATGFTKRFEETCSNFYNQGSQGEPQLEISRLPSKYPLRITLPNDNVSGEFHTHQISG
jgi:hypothetical protein